MTDIITYDSGTPRLALPMLFSGQSQKEVTVNEALLLIDAMLTPAVEAISATPPSTPAPGQAWIVGADPTGAFAGHADDIALWTDGGWRFIVPLPGMVIENKLRNCRFRFFSTWQCAVAPALPSGGSTIDTQARATISTLISLLVTSGIFSAA